MSHDPSNVFAHFYIDGQWRETYDGEDLSARVRGRDAIRISRGGSDQFSSITSQSCDFTLNNGDNFFTDDDPNSPLFRKFGQNTRARFGVLDAARGLDLHGRFSEIPNDSAGERWYTADKASLDITGDIDIRWEMDMRWTRNRQQYIVGKYTMVSDERSFVVYSQLDGRLAIRTSPDGTNGSSIFRASTASMIPEAEGRLAYRVTLDVNNGAGGRVYSWYTAPSLAGSWTLAATETVAGTTSIYAGTSNLQLGYANEALILFTDVFPFSGKLHGLEIYNGIAGTLVADFNPNQDAELGDTTWVDTCASPNTWLIDTAGTGKLPAYRVGSDQVSFTGELQNRPDDWDLTGNDRWCAMNAQGILSRYSSRKASLQSASRRYWSRVADIVGYWPCEDGADADSVSSGLPDGFPAEVNDVSFGDADGYGGSTGAVRLNQAGASYVYCTANEHAGSGAWSFVFSFKMEDLSATEEVLCNLYPIFSNITRWAIQVGLSTYRFTAYDSGGVIIANVFGTFGDTNPSTGWVIMMMSFKQEGGNIRYETSYRSIDSDLTWTHSGGGSTVAGTVGQAYRAYFNPSNVAFDDVQISQIVFANYEYEINTNSATDVATGFSGETAGNRFVRLLQEEGLPLDWVGLLDDTEPMGPQLPETLYDNLESCALTDGGLVCEARDVIAIRFITAGALGNRKRLSLSYSGSHLTETPRPTDPGRFTVNDFTANRSDGGSYRYEANDTRRKNVREPDDASPGVGRIERSGTFNSETDARLQYLASFRVFLGTWDERYIPTMVVSTHRTEIESSASLLSTVHSQDIGDPVVITDVIGSPMPPNDARAAVTGYTETIENLERTLRFNTVPNGPYMTPVLTSSADDHLPVMDVEGDESTLDGALNSTATSIPIKTLLTATVDRWVDDAGYPADIGAGETIDIDINGERVRVSSITAPSVSGLYHDQTFTVTRSINGVVKSHADGVVIKLFTPSYLGKI